MLARSGNMDDVYRRTQRLLMRKIKRGAVQSINAAVERSSQMECEFEEGATADWYLVKTFPGDDARAMRWLARRRFGVFRAMQQKIDKRSGAALQGLESVFPGWLFVYVWDIKKLKARLLATPGVMAMLCDPVTQEPVPVNRPDARGVYFIDKLRGLSWVYEDNAPRARRVPSLDQPVKTRQRRPDKRQRKALDKLKETLKQQGRWDASAWDCANELAPHQRIALLQRFLDGSAVVG